MGTFAPVKADHILDHKMHTESYRLESSTLEALRSSQYKVAVGTTSLRALESVRKDPDWPNIRPSEIKTTNIFLYPGVQVSSIDALVTNFHLPKSSLLMLVSSLIGREKTLELYQTAIEKKYRFYSYGDGMLIKRKRL
jgi:S-adenosylmethionine:tRNA ribosyltransferase-isomerase